MSKLADEIIIKEEKKKKKKKGGGIKVILVLLMMFILIPSLVITGFYFVNETFKYRMNAALAEAPGVIGNYFDTIPTRNEKEMQINMIAEYFLQISRDRAVDKLSLYYKDEPKMYTSIMKSMLMMDPNSTKIIMDNIREKQIKGDVVSSTLDEIVEERNVELSGVAEDLQNIPFSELKNEMYEIINDGLNGVSKLAKILEQMDSVKAFELLSLLDDVDKDSVTNSMSLEAKESIRKEMNKDMANNQRLISLSEIYSTKDPNELVDLLSNTNTYKIEELAVIFKELGVLKTGRILTTAVEPNFVTDLITEIKNNEVLENGEDLITKDILKTLKIYKDFDDKVLQLTNIYSAMGVDKVATLLKQLFVAGSLPQTYVLGSGDIIQISDEELALKVLKNFDDKKIAEIIGLFENSLAAEVSKQLTIPEY